MNKREGTLLDTLRQQGFFASRGIDEPAADEETTQP
jgi:hypothetical protein